MNKPRTGITQAIIKRMLTIAMANTDFVLALIIQGKSNGAIKEIECRIKTNAKGMTIEIPKCIKRIQTKNICLINSFVGEPDFFGFVLSKRCVTRINKETVVINPKINIMASK